MKGWTYPEIDALTFADALEVLEYTRDNPPMVDCVRAYLGVKTRRTHSRSEVRDITPEEVTPEQFEALVQESKSFADNFKGPQG